MMRWEPENTMNKKTLLLLAGSFTLPLPVLAETYIYQAISDFPDTNAGEIPFYKDTVGKRNVLAINAAKEEYRDKFARATKTFDGEAGTYDVTIVALGEVDGECIYRLSINGNIIGIKENARTNNDYGEQEHVFKDVVIPAGATISVDASAVSNRLIPENGGFAYARGRWRSLSVSTAGEVSDDIDLALTISGAPTSANVSDTINYSITVNNLSADRTASGLSVSSSLPTELRFGASADCSVGNNEVSCLLPELAPKTSNTVSWSAKAISAGNVTINASVSADQEDKVISNNTATSSTVVSAANITKDAGITLALVDDMLMTTEFGKLTVRVENKGVNDLAAVIVELSAGPDLTFSKPFESCVQQDNKLTCTIDSLLSNETETLNSDVSSSVAGTYTIEAKVLIGGDEVIENNSANTMLDIEQAETITQTEPDSSKSNSGGVAFIMLGLLSLLTFRRRAH